MFSENSQQKQRQRAPSARSLQTRAAILDAAERCFARGGFDAASMRDIASDAGVRVGLVHHHSGGKEELFRLVVARRAKTLSALRLDALEARKSEGPLDVHAVLRCFFGPYLTQAREGGPQWLAYARLVAHVSADPRWRDIAAESFDPTAARFIAEIQSLFPEAEPRLVALGFVYSVASMLAQLTSAWRVDVLGGEASAVPLEAEQLVAFCAAGIVAIVERDQI